MHTVFPIAFWATTAFVVVAAVIDVRTQRIPNWLSLPCLVAGLGFSGMTHGWSGLGLSLLGLLTAALVFGIFCYLGGMGMGDVKLFAAVGAWLGPAQTFAALLYTGVAGGIIAICWSLAGGFLVQSVRGTAALISGFARRGLQPHETIVLDNPMTRRIPYAPAIAIGAILSFLLKH